MTRAQRRGADLERKAARLIGGRRVVRARYEVAPDILPIALPSGELLQLECKKRRAIPTYVREGLAQCARYTPDAVGVVVIEETRGEPLAVLRLRDLVRLLGIAPC